MNKIMDDEFKTLCEAYGEGLPDKIRDIEDAFDSLSDSWSTASYSKLSSLIHNLHGSAGIYGFAATGQRAAEIERYLSGFDYDIPADKEQMDKIASLVQDIKNSVRTHNTDVHQFSPEKIHSNQVYFLKDKDRDATEKSRTAQLLAQAAIYGYEISLFHNLESLFSAIAVKTPAALLVSFDLLSNPYVVNLPDINVQKMINLYFKKIHTIFISASGDFTKRLQAVRMGCKSYLIMPFDTDELIRDLDNLKFIWEGHFRAVIVDDSPEILSWYAKLLTEAGIETRAMTSYSDLERELHDFRPDIILLDLNMPECSGREIATIIRQQKAWENIPVVFLSTEENRKIQLDAMSMGADDFITKGSDPDDLIRLIRIRAGRYRKIRDIISKDGLTGAFSFRYMTAEIQKYINSFNKSGKTFSLCVVQPDNTSGIKNTYGYTASDQILVSLYVLLNNLTDNSAVIGQHSMDKFLLIFPGQGEEDVKARMKDIQNKFHSTLQYSNGKAFASSFSIGVAACYEGCSIESLIRMADEDLEKSKQKMGPKG